MEPTRNWIFTFGCNHAYPGKYVKIEGTYESARAEMFRIFGDRWAFQYSEEAWQEIVDNPKRVWPVEEELDEESWKELRGSNQERTTEGE